MVLTAVTRLMAALCLALCAFGSSYVFAQPLPPLGKRQYLLGERLAAPVVIEPVESTRTQRYMRDPDQPTSIKLTSKKPPIKPKPQVARPKPGFLRFAKLPITGHLQQPRVDFTLEALPLDRSDEPVGEDFFPKVFAPASDDTF